MKVVDKVGLIAMGVIIITNPASSQFILVALDWIFQQIFIYASPVEFAASGVVIGCMLHRMWVTREKTTIPKTGKSQKYVTT